MSQTISILATTRQTVTQVSPVQAERVVTTPQRVAQTITPVVVGQQGPAGASVAALEPRISALENEQENAVKTVNTNW